MTDIAGRLSGVTVILEVDAFLRGYLGSTLLEAEASIIASPSFGEIEQVARVSSPVIACIEVDALERDLSLEQRVRSQGIPCLLLLGVRSSEDYRDARRGPSLRQPFAAFQVVNALTALSESRL